MTRGGYVFHGESPIGERFVLAFRGDLKQQSFVVAAGGARHASADASEDFVFLKGREAE
jgi:hypothetical protein